MLSISLYILIGAFSTASYIVALSNIQAGNYRPNSFSRGVWAVLSMNSFAGVIASKSTAASVVLALVMMVGSMCVFLASMKHGKLIVGRLEYFCMTLLLISLFIWLYFDQPLINLSISLVAYFVGAFPTYRQVWRRPQSESRLFWGLFCIASLLSVAASYNMPFNKQLIPLYFTIFDGTLFLLSIRKHR